MATAHATRTGDQVLTDLADGVLTVTINRPDRMNAFTTDVMLDLVDVIESAARPEVRVVVITGAGHAFSAGADIVSDGGPGSERSDGSTEIDAANRLVAAIRDLPRPVVAAVNGPAAGVAVPIALAADLTVARGDAYFLLAFTRIGLMPDGGASALVAASVGRATAMRMALLADKLPASEAREMGLIAAHWSANDFDAELAALVARLSQGPTAAYARTKEAINGATLTELDATFAREREGQIGLIASHDFIEGAKAFAEKRAPRFTDI